MPRVRWVSGANAGTVEDLPQHAYDSQVGSGLAVPAGDDEEDGPHEVRGTTDAPPPGSIASRELAARRERERADDAAGEDRREGEEDTASPSRRRRPARRK